MRNRTAYTEGNNSSSVIEGDNGKKYCPNDSRLLIYRNDIQILFCVECGYTPEGIDEKTTSNHNKAADNDIWIIPMTQPRSELTRQRLRMQSHQGWDRDMQRMQDADYSIKDTREIVNDAGAYSCSNSTSGVRKVYH
jgi:hypothetical protein